MITFSPSLPIAALFRSRIVTLGSLMNGWSSRLTASSLSSCRRTPARARSSPRPLSPSSDMNLGAIAATCMAIVGERLEVLGACHKIGFAIDLHERGNAAATVDVGLNDALLRCRPAFFSAFASPCCIRSDCARRTSPSASSSARLLSMMPASVRSRALYLCRANRHDLLFSIMCSRQSIDGMLPMGSTQLNRQERCRRWPPCNTLRLDGLRFDRLFHIDSDILDCIVDNIAAAASSA